MTPVERCPDCDEPMDFDDRRRQRVCYACEEVEAVDKALGSGQIDVNEYDEEDRP